MKVDLKHPAIERCSQKAFNEVFEKTLSINSFCYHVNIVSDMIESTPEQEPNLLYVPFYSEKDIRIAHERNRILPLSGRNVAMKFKGDIFELFVEFFIKACPFDERIDVFDYHLVTKDDTGVDGWGYNRKGEKITVQVKYRMWDMELKAIRDHLNNFRDTSYMKYDIDPQAVGRMLIITTGKGIHWETLEKQFSGKVRCISNDASYGCLAGSINQTIRGIFSLQSVADGSMMFWKSLKDNIERQK